MNSNNIALYKIKNTSKSTLLGVSSGESKIIFLNPQYYHTYGLDAILKSIETGDLVIYDISNTAIAYYNAYTRMQGLWNEVLNFTQKLQNSTEISANHQLAVKLEWNLNSVSSIVALIGEDVLSTDFTALGVTRASTIDKIKPIFDLLSIGQYTEAVTALDAIVLDAYYTSSRISDYKTIVSGVDSFNFVL